MRRLILLPMCVLIVSACEQSAREATPDTTLEDTPRLEEEISTFTGADAYELACARCHEEGIDGAPRTGDPDAWAGRSMLWEAVLFEHANQGYQDMPAKGGYETLTDDLVEKAAEYMLSRTTKAPPSE